MPVDVYREMATLEAMTLPELRARYAEVCGQTTRGRNRQSLIRRIVWRLQALAEGDLSERARRRAEELANDADLRLHPPRKASRAPEVRPRMWILPNIRVSRYRTARPSSR